jgi:NAD(P)H dehydrogenase (quinone)
MAEYVMSGASGSLGSKITEQLLEKVPADNLSVSTRTPKNLDALSQRGVAVHAADYNDPAALERAYAGPDVLMLISSLAVTKRVPEHRKAINAAKRAGIKHIVYTSTAGSRSRSAPVRRSEPNTEVHKVPKRHTIRDAPPSQCRDWAEVQSDIR